MNSSSLTSVQAYSAKRTRLIKLSNFKFYSILMEVPITARICERGIVNGLY